MLIYFLNYCFDCMLRLEIINMRNNFIVKYMIIMFWFFAIVIIIVLASVIIIVILSNIFIIFP